jgi:The ARF-like 2 binding protein BART
VSVSDEMPKTIVAKVQAFCETNDFEKQFEAFALDKYSVFKDILELQKGDEQPIEYYNVYNQYLEMFEGRIEHFIVKVMQLIYVFRVLLVLK